MSRNKIFVLMYHRHKLLHLINLTQSYKHCFKLQKQKRKAKLQAILFTYKTKSLHFIFVMNYAG
jgi:hypothetical protein